MGNAIQTLFDPPLPDLIRVAILGCRYLAFGVAFPIIFLMLLDASAYVVFRTLGVYARRVRVVDNVSNPIAVDIATISSVEKKENSSLIRNAFLEGINNDNFNKRSNINKQCLKTLASNLKASSNDLHAHKAANIPLPPDADRGLRHRQPLTAA
ncbi:hypothetical protein E3P92_01846 [Wallemia ichthyophaga]|uniref:Uncharacterized protein n=2 Tax=Wallemia ichthyophaga TaxID=245174 RepID=A0A4T0IMC8_WALIC|nr:uncharacterized protein J056_004863 [Wallemia ichthyophaga EXF-994]TIB01139.1 hypothetical protein E3P95_01403 [Wallemia ichthyophaga]EOR01051.1 hypothetical protein J056_004863 [Wallemia ichthyophaga EXF-994]TIB02178.1 hypothetical protein E3P94_01535 [Wallemia ichthyophaga]TIB14768.1 hypothetical protein E3P92_01846 [Wallemia ichthyophaga]TIB15998.1 hypothetical protein E3P90_00652 [Wallemia ichthyophaga]